MTTLLLIAALLGDLVGVVVGLLDCVVRALLAGNGRGELLAHARAQILEFRDLHELDARVRDGFDRGMRRVGVLDRVERDGGEALGIVLIARLIVGGLPGTARYRAPAR